MAARKDSSTDSTSSEDEEDKARLKEAVFDTRHFSSGKDNGNLRELDKSKILPSKRSDKKTNNEDFKNVFDTTPGFRKHVSRKLSEALDSEIDDTAQCFHTRVSKAVQNDGVKLFSNSTSFLLEDDDGKVEKRKVVRKRVSSSSDDSSSEDERLAEASVSHDFVIQQSNLPSLTTKKPADIIIKHSDTELSAVVNKEVCNGKKNCSYAISENGTDKVKSAMLDVREKLKQDESFELESKACKKKKKKHKKEKSDQNC